MEELENCKILLEQAEDIWADFEKNTNEVVDIFLLIHFEVYCNFYMSSRKIILSQNLLKTQLVNFTQNWWKG